MIKSFFKAALLLVPGLALAATPAAETQLDRAVAVFVASNIKLAVDNALHNLVATGVEVDTALVKTLIFEELSRPYNAEEHNVANTIIGSAVSARAVAESQQFLADAAAREGAKVLPDGLVIETLAPGEGSSPSAESTVLFRYTGSLPDGTVFDSIGPGEEPLKAVVADLTPGMTEGLQLMQPGGRYRLTLPSELGYGKEGVPGVIPPDCALQFDIELIEII